MKRLIAFVFAVIYLAACQKAPVLSISSPSNVELSADGSTASITFTANRDWRATSSDSWVTISPSSGTASDNPVSITVRSNANTTYDDRTATVTISMEELSQTVSVRQPANLGVVLPKQVFDLQADAKSIDVEVQANVQYSVSTSADWIKHTGTKGLTSKTLTFSIEENKTYDSREGEIVIKPQDSSVQEQMISVRQAQKDALKVEKTSYEMPYGGGEIEVKVEANVSFDVMTDSDWIHYSQTKALSSSTICLKIDENKAYDSRVGRIEIEQKNGSLKHTITIKQKQAEGLFVNPTSFDLSYEAQSVELEVKNNVSFNIEIPDEAKDWISVQSNTQTKALTEDTVVIAIGFNDRSSKREASISIKQKGGSIFENVVIKQACFEGLSVSQNSFQVDKEAQTIEFSVISSAEYDVFNSAGGWVSEISHTDVNAVETIYKYHISENSNHQSRNATITFKQKTSEKTVTVNISQEPTFYITLREFFSGVFSSFEQQFSITFESNGKPLTYSCNKEWIRFISLENTLLTPAAIFAIDENKTRDDREAVITIKTANEAVSFDLTVMQKGVREVPEGAVELGLSVLWAECNIESSSPEVFGGYYAWGEVETKDVYNNSTYKWYDNSINGYSWPMSKYNHDDHLSILEPEDDIATVKLGKRWRMPTSIECRELYEKCSWETITINGIAGQKGTSSINGNTIFIPFAGFKVDDGIYSVGADYGIWTSTFRDNTVNSVYAWFLTNSLGIFARERRVGFSVRAVYE